MRHWGEFGAPESLPCRDVEVGDIAVVAGCVHVFTGVLTGNGWQELKSIGATSEEGAEP